MAWTKSPRGLIDLFDASLPHAPGVGRRQMFGCPCAFVNGNMFAGVLQEIIFARLPPGLRAELDAEHGVQNFEPMPGRPMRAYAVLPEAVMDDEGQVAALLTAACAFTAAMPPKVKTPRKRKV